MDRTFESRQVSVLVDRTAADVYAFASEPANLPAWASGLGRSVEVIDGRLIVESPMGRVVVTFAPRNDFGVLDHEVTLPSGETDYNPMRVTTAGDGAEVVFSVRRRPGMTDEEFARDVETVRTDLETLKQLLQKQ